MTPIEKRIKKVSEIEGYLSCVLYGRSSTGKTTLACSFPKPLLLVDMNDKGTGSVKDVKGVEVFECQDLEDLDDLYWHVKKSKRYRSVVLDTMSMMQGQAIDFVSKGKKGFVMGRREWGQVGGHMTSRIQRWRDLPMNVVFIAQDRVSKGGDDEDEDSDGQILPEVGPRVMPSVASFLNASVSVIGNTFIREDIKRIKTPDKKIVEKRNVEYCLRIGPHAYYTTKVRKPKSVVVPAFIVDPTYEKLVANLKE